MPFEELIADIHKVKIEETRTSSNNFFEAVLVQDELVGLIVVLEKFFGQPAWPSKKRLPVNIKNHIREFGGIMPGQTLYFCSNDDSTVIAMLWPWTDRQHTTLKIIKR